MTAVQLCRSARGRLGRRYAQAKARDPEAGSGAVIMIFVVFIILALSGLIIDGGNALTMRQQASNEAGEAARAVAGDVSVTALRNGKIVINAAQCWSKADQTVAAYAQGTVTACSVAGRDVTVSVAIPYHPIMLGLLDPNLTFVARATVTAHLAAGITNGS
jgi:Flp pilus assembly protein TadG